MKVPTVLFYNLLLTAQLFLFLQRKDYSVLAKFLPPKQEFVLAVRITPLQYKLYRYYLDHITGKNPSARFCTVSA